MTTVLQNHATVNFNITLPQVQKELFEYMLQKADLDANEAIQAFIGHWINQNSDLLSPQDIERFGNMFFMSKNV